MALDIATKKKELDAEIVKIKESKKYQPLFEAKKLNPDQVRKWEDYKYINLTRRSERDLLYPIITLIGCAIKSINSEAKYDFSKNIAISTELRIITKDAPSQKERKADIGIINDLNSKALVIIEIKFNDIDEGLVQNCDQMRAYAMQENCNKVYGIATTAEKWYGTSYSTPENQQGEKFQVAEPRLLNLSNASEPELLGVINLIRALILLGAETLQLEAKKA